MWRELRKKIGEIRRGGGQMNCRPEMDMEGKQKLKGGPRQGSGNQKDRKVKKETKEQ